MSSSGWIATVILGMGVSYLIWFVYKISTERRVRDERDPEAPRDVERGHARTEAEMARAETDRLSKADEAEVAEFAAFFEEIGTGEFTLLAFDADPLSAPIPEDRLLAAPVDFHAAWAERLSLFTWTAAPAPTPLSSVQVLEPEPLHLESFTRGWTRAQIEAMVAGAKAEATR